VGALVGLGGIAVLMIVFEEVDGIDRMKAFGLAATIGGRLLGRIHLVGHRWKPSYYPELIQNSHRQKNLTDGVA